MTTETETMLSELDSVIRLLEARLPGSLSDPQNAKLVKSLETSMADYFRQVELALPMADIENLYYKRTQEVTNARH